MTRKQAAKIMDPLFLRQAWAGNETLLLDLIKDNSPLGRERLHAFLLNKGPWSRLDHNAPFVPGVPGDVSTPRFHPGPGARHSGRTRLAELLSSVRASARVDHLPSERQLGASAKLGRAGRLTRPWSASGRRARSRLQSLRSALLQAADAIPQALERIEESKLAAHF